MCSSEFPSPTAANPVPISDAKPPRPSDVDSEASGVGGCTTLRDLEVGVRATRHVCDLSTTVQGQVDCEHSLYTKQQVTKVGGVKRTCGKGTSSAGLRPGTVVTCSGPGSIPPIVQLQKLGLIMS